MRFRRSWSLMQVMFLVMCAMAPASYPQSIPDPQSPGSLQSPPTQSTMESWLLSGNPRLMAWGAHDAMLAKDESLVPDLLSIAAEWKPLVPESENTAASYKSFSPSQMQQRDSMTAVLDALIQLGAIPPANALRELAPDFPNATAVLLTRMPAGERENVAYELFSTSRHDNAFGLQFVSAALLAQHPVSGFAEALMSGIQVQSVVSVVDPGSSPGGRGFAGDCMGTPEDKNIPGWPISGHYTLLKENEPEAAPLVDGTVPIYTRRDEAARSYPDSACRTLRLTAEDRRRLIAQMLHAEPDVIPWQTYPSTQIQFKSMPQYTWDLLAFAAGQQALYRATAHALAAARLLETADIESALPQLNLGMSDERSEASVPLVPPSDLPAHVTWSPRWSPPY